MKQEGNLKRSRNRFQCCEHEVGFERNFDVVTLVRDFIAESFGVSLFSLPMGKFIKSNFVEPCLEGAVTFVTPHVLPGFYEGELGEVFRILSLPGEVQQKAINAGVMKGYELLNRRPVAVGYALGGLVIAGVKLGHG